MPEFTGAKVALLLGDEVLMTLRDNKPGLPFANMWDFAGGGREGGETPFECLRREVEEELSIKLEPSSIIWQKEHPAMIDPTQRAYFMVAKITEDQIKTTKLGEEGQKWELMDISQVLSRSDVVPHLKQRFQDYLDANGTRI